jgi:hypothetical protein
MFISELLYLNFLNKILAQQLVAYISNEREDSINQFDDSPFNIKDRFLGLMKRRQDMMFYPFYLLFYL